ncbi:MAG: hypothetical protein HRU31_03760 [Rhodobacteraceae bacterium]|nr:hypothetical protein [Paracoccaceae bacterium]
MNSPAIKVLAGPSLTMQAASETTTAGLSGLLSAGSLAVDLMPHDREDLVVFLHNKLAMARMAQAKSTHFLGRLYNRFAGEDPEYVEFSGAHLKQVLAFAGRSVPGGVSASGSYGLRVDIAQQALDRLRQEGAEAE